MTKTRLLVGTLILALLAGAAAVKLVFFPSVKEVYFAMNNRSLLRVPAHLVVVRPTHFANSRRKGIMFTAIPVSGKSVQRMMGRNVPLRDVIAAAYGRNSARVALPSDAPKGNFDFLVTVSANPEQRLQAAIRRKLGYTAQTETCDANVLAMKIEDSRLPGLTVSDAGKEHVDFNNGKLYFTHMRLAGMTAGLEQMLNTPVVDKTGLTNYYDFSLVWDAQTQRQLRNGVMTRDTAGKILNGWGLGLEPDMASIEMLVVRKAN